MKKTLIILNFLLLSLFVIGQPTEFQGLDESSNSQALIFGTMQFNGVMSETGDWIAAFDEQGNIVGTYEINSGFFVMILYGSSDQLESGEMFTLRGWDASAYDGAGEYFAKGDPEEEFGPWSPQTAGGYLPGFSTSTSPTFNINFDISLPIELNSFDIKSKSCNSYELNWVTESEINNEYFTLERSIDNTHRFEAIGKIDGAGNSNEKVSYSFTDEIFQVGSHDLYYRLKQTDFDGRFTYSDIITARYDCEDIRSLKAYPNPFNTNIALNDIGNTSNTLRVSNNLGQIVYQSDLTNANVNTSDWLPGVYYLQEIDGGSIISTNKLVK